MSDGLESAGSPQSARTTTAGQFADGNPDTGADLRNDTHAHDGTIFDLLGSRLDGGRESLHEQNLSRSAPADSDHLLDDLYVRYCKALDWQEPLMPGTWVPSSRSVSVDRMIDTPREEEGHTTGAAISGLFPDIESVDEAFGPLVANAMTRDEDCDRAPEILRLFAPPEYLVKGRVRTVFPPALTRREHHTLSIDSPVMELGSTSQKQERGQLMSSGHNNDHWRPAASERIAAETKDNGEAQ
ncbi:TagK domain-containing protein [Paraburkholderia azotifigens]|uniref:TagK domain-containing protein n=2 Tax=Paraburkholderia azotifigens TaxID=2057004 RepID=A0ABU9R7Y0_9BURK